MNYSLSISLSLPKELFTGTSNSDIRNLCTVHCGRNVHKPSTLTEVEGKGLKLWCDIKVQQKIYQVWTNTFWLSGQYGKYNINILLFHPLGPFPTKMMRCPWILCFDLLPLQTQIWRIRCGGSWSIYFLSLPTSYTCLTDNI